MVLFRKENRTNKESPSLLVFNDKLGFIKTQNSLFQRNPVDSLTFLVIHKVGIYLRCGDILVNKHLADRINICARGNLQCGVSMAAHVHNLSKSNGK